MRKYNGKKDTVPTKMLMVIKKPGNKHAISLRINVT